MPGSEAAVRRTDAYRRGTWALRGLAVAAAAAAWQAVQPDDIDESAGDALAGVAAATAAYQAAAVALSNRYAAMFVADELGRLSPVAQADLAVFVGGSRIAGKSLTDAALAAPIRAKRLIGTGEQPDAAVRAAGSYLAGNMGEEVMHAARGALEAVITDDPQIVGYRRIAGGRACAACLALMDNSTQFRPLPVHNSCNCSAEPIVRGVRERVVRPTGAEVVASMAPEQMDSQFGPAAAAALRDGSVELSDLVAHSHLGAVGDRVTQAPLSAG